MILQRSLLAMSLSLVAVSSYAKADESTELASRGFFISIDGLNPSLLEPMHDQGQLAERHGLGWLMEQGIYAPKTWPVVTTLTAASHISTITCTPPSRHGITANNFLKAGQKVSGFGADFTAEPLWKAASRQGFKTLALAYVGADGRTPDRSADFGLAYPDDALLGPTQTLSWDPSALVAASGWTLTPILSARTDLKEATITLVLNPRTLETKTVQVLIDLASAEPELYFDADKNLTNGQFGQAHVGDTKVIDFFFTEEADASVLKGYKRRAFARILPRTDAMLDVYVSKTSYNNAYPATFRQQLDDANMVWPDYGIRSNKLSTIENIETLSMIDRFLTDVGVRFAPKLGADVVLFYQPLLDSIGHKYQSALPLPFNPDGTDDVTKAFVYGFKVIDQNISRLLDRVRPRDVVALMGDHGMDPAVKVVNLAPLLPHNELSHIEVVTSGALAMIYAPVADQSAQASAAADAIGVTLREALANVTFDGKSALGEAIRKSDPATRNTRRFGDEWHYGEALWGITAGSGFYLQYDPLSDQVLDDASALGMHGQALSVPTMATALMIMGPGLRSRHVDEASLIDAVPTFADLMGMQPPLDCLGRSMRTR